MYELVAISYIDFDFKNLPIFQIIEDIYKKELLGTRFSIRRVMLLEFSQYLENYLWPNFHPDKSSHAHIMSMVAMVNEKFRERVPAWGVS